MWVISKIICSNNYHVKIDNTFFLENPLTGRTSRLNWEKEIFFFFCKAKKQKLLFYLSEHGEANDGENEGESRVDDARQAQVDVAAKPERRCRRGSRVRS